MSVQNSSNPSLLVVELDYHIDLLDVFLILIDKSFFSTSCLTSKTIHQKLSAEAKEGVNFYFSQASEIPGLIEELNPSLIFFNTCASHYKMWSKMNLPFSVLRIHNINSYFAGFESIRMPHGFYEIRKWITHFTWRILFKNDLLYRRRLLKKIDKFSFLSESNFNYFKTKFPYLSHKAGPSFPIALFDSDFIKKQPDDPLVVVIPGTLESKRKDLDVIEGLVKSISESEYRVELIFAGKSTPQTIPLLNRLKKMEREGFSIVSFKEFLPLTLFDKIVRRADLMVFPIRLRTSYKIFSEVYGITKISGNAKDLIRYGKYSLMPEEYPVSGPEKSLIFAYRDEDDIFSVLKKAIQSYEQNFVEYHLKLEEHKKLYFYEASKDDLNEKLKYFLTCLPG